MNLLEQLMVQKLIFLNVNFQVSFSCYVMYQKPQRSRVNQRSGSRGRRESSRNLDDPQNRKLVHCLVNIIIYKYLRVVGKESFMRVKDGKMHETQVRVILQSTFQRSHNSYPISHWFSDSIDFFSNCLVSCVLTILTTSQIQGRA